MHETGNSTTFSSSRPPHATTYTKMAAPRLPFLWPMLWKTTEASTPAVRCVREAARSRAIHRSTSRKQRENIQHRYGSANEPPPHLGGGKRLGPLTNQRQATEEQNNLPKIGGKPQNDDETGMKSTQPQVERAATNEKEKALMTVDGERPDSVHSDPMLNGSESMAPEGSHGSPDQPSVKPIESLLDKVPDPNEQQKQNEQFASASKAPEEEHPDISHDEHSPPVKIPHMDTPRHVHHFDTYGLVKHLTEAGWENDQAVTIMKAVRLMLADNMDLACEALVSKSNVENETYLFRAACAELKTEVTSRRKAEQEKMRTERNQLQHEVDILGQRLGQESAAMKDELKGMFDDRKMAVRNEQRAMESKIQQLNYKITVSLQADARSDVEGLRWVMTRRVIITLGIVVIMVLGSLKLFSNAAREEEMDEKKKGKKSNAVAGEFVPQAESAGSDRKEVRNGEFIPEAELSAAG